MGYFLILLIAFVIGMIISYWSEGYFDEFTIIGGMIGAMFGFIVMLFVSLLIHGIFDSEEYISHKTHIVALSDNVTSSGQFFLGSGSIDGEMTYFYMVQEKKGMKIENVSADTSYMVEEDRNDGLIEESDKRFKNKMVEHWFPNWESGDIVIKIPKGSILRNYQVDLQN